MTIWTSVLWKKKIHMAKTEFRLKIKICSLSCVLRVIYNNFLVSNIFFFKFQMGRQVGAAATWTAEWMAEFTRMFSRNNAMPNYNWKILSNVFFNKKKLLEGSNDTRQISAKRKEIPPTQPHFKKAFSWNWPKRFPI